MSLAKLWRRRWYVRAFFPSLVFNLRHLPLSIAWRIPIFIYKGRFAGNAGKFVFNCKVRTAMVRLGRNSVPVFPNSGCMLQNNGTIVFNGKTIIGNDSALVVSPGATLEFGDSFSATCGLKVICSQHVKFGRNVLVGWNTLFVDTDFHSLKNIATSEKSRNAQGPISIGNDVWIANGCKFYKNSSISDRCVVGADTIVRQPVICPGGSLITNGRNLRIRTTGYYHDSTDDAILPDNRMETQQ